MECAMIAWQRKFQGYPEKNVIQKLPKRKTKVVAQPYPEQACQTMHQNQPIITYYSVYLKKGPATFIRANATFLTKQMHYCK
ncbi:hypothetical protein BVRB_1g011100 [Beta vulgaris subsp. vulgaris]|nr:hypothetical protein BVRB_1g011100 [Beta vulgaris subsp. vulgaris]